MPQFRPKATLDRSVDADIFRNTLSKIPTVFGQLGYLASLRDSHTGAYRHHGLAGIFGREESKKALAESHRRVFRQWLNLSMEAKRDDLAAYLNNLDEPRQEVLGYWMRITAQPSWFPVSIRTGDQRLFVAEFEIVLKLLACATDSPK